MYKETRVYYSSCFCESAIFYSFLFYSIQVASSVLFRSGLFYCFLPGRVAQSVGHLTRKSGVLGSIPNILSFLLPLFQEGQLSVTNESMCTKYWLTAQEV